MQHTYRYSMLFIEYLMNKVENLLYVSFMRMILLIVLFIYLIHSFILY